VSDVTDRRRAEAAVRRSQVLSQRLLQAATGLATALTFEQVDQVMAEIGGSAVGAQWSGVALLEGSVLRYRSASAKSGEHRLPAYLPDIPLGIRIPTTEAYREGVPVFLSSREEIRARMPSDVIEGFLRDSFEHSWAVLPLRSGGRTVGVLRFAFDHPRVLAPEDRTFLEALAGQCAIAVERSRLYERERSTASALQESLLPDELPEVEGLDLAARFLPGTGEVAVGGDWYDAFPLPDGRLALVVGDVMGKGVRAAAGMGRVRSALRALALIDPSPAAVLSGLDRIYTATESVDEIATLVYLVVDPRTGEVLAGDAGHLPLLVLPLDGPPVMIDIAAESTPLGLPEEREQHRVVLAPGDILVGFSDGLVERRDRSLDEGFALLLEAAGAAPSRGDLGPLVAGLVATLVPDGAADDATVLAVRVQRPVA
jgi:serine phosphatase RsbU (regulator of sigma subunit)